MVVDRLKEENYNNNFMKIYSIQKSKKVSNEQSEIFVIEPLESGQGITIGNTLRRILLSELYGFAIIEAQISNISNEFEQPGFLREDIIEMLLNLKQVALKPTISFLRDIEQQKINYKTFTKIKGPTIVTAGMLNIPNQLKVLNSSQYICTIVDDSELQLILTIRYDKAFKIANELKSSNFFEKIYLKEGFPLNIDAVFLPVKKINYKVKNIHDNQGNIKESLILEIITNGTITPKRALLQALNFCLKLFYPILSLGLKAEKLIFFFNNF
jgi:DNA-directed RNA polymerase subunit alpha